MKLNTLMEERGMSGYALSKESGVSYTVIKALLRGEKKTENLAGKTIFALSKVLGCTMEEFIKLETEKI